jgi:hypothetical protein
MRSLGRCSGNGRRAGLRRSKLHTSTFATAIGAVVSTSEVSLSRVGKLKLELFEDRTPLRGLPDPIVAELGDRVLQLRDQQWNLASFSAANRVARSAISIAFSADSSSERENPSVPHHQYGIVPRSPFGNTLRVPTVEPLCPLL